MAEGNLVLWAASTREDRAHEIVKRLGWTMAKGGEISHPAPYVFVWPLKTAATHGLLMDIAGSLTREERYTWALALLSKPPSQQLIQLLPRLHGEIVIDERTVGADFARRRDHPLAGLLRELGLALWDPESRQFERENDDLLDPTVALRKMRNVPASPHEQLEPQRIAVRLPKGRTAGDYAHVAYADVPDGSEDHNSLGGRHVLLFHSAMKCGYPPFEPPEQERSRRPPYLESAGEPGVFVFLNAAAVGVKFVPVDNDHPNSLVAHLRVGRIHIERGIAEPEEHHVPVRPDFEERDR